MIINVSKIVGYCNSKLRGGTRCKVFLIIILSFYMILMIVT